MLSLYPRCVDQQSIAYAAMTSHQLICFIAHPAVIGATDLPAILRAKHLSAPLTFTRVVPPSHGTACFVAADPINPHFLALVAHSVQSSRLSVGIMPERTKHSFLKQSGQYQSRWYRVLSICSAAERGIASSHILHVTYTPVMFNPPG